MAVVTLFPCMLISSWIHSRIGLELHNNGLATKMWQPHSVLLLGYVKWEPSKSATRIYTTSSSPRWGENKMVSLPFFHAGRQNCFSGLTMSAGVVSKGIGLPLNLAKCRNREACTCPRLAVSFCEMRTFQKDCLKSIYGKKC